MSTNIKALKTSYDDYNDYLIGLTIYYQLIPKALRWTNKGSFNRVKGRIQKAILDAEEIFFKRESGEDVSKLIDAFIWPPK